MFYSAFLLLRSNLSKYVYEKGPILADPDFPAINLDTGEAYLFRMVKIWMNTSFIGVEMKPIIYIAYAILIFHVPQLQYIDSDVDKYH